jgi:hypothetical protein
MSDKHSPEQIIEILRSIKYLSITDGELDTYFVDSEIPEGINSFIPGSFTRELLEMIESHLLDTEIKGQDICSDCGFYHPGVNCLDS